MSWLSSYDQDELQRRETLKKQAEAEAQRRQAADDAKRAADDAGKNFVLTGSARPRDQAASRGQMELMDVR
jgi:hypothetical protein